MNQSQSKLVSIQNLRGIAALSVVLFHLAALERHCWPSATHWLYPFLRLGFGGVDIFFVLSGFLMVTIHRNDFGKSESVFKFLWKRFIRIYPIYWLICLPKVLLCEHPERFAQAFFLLPLPGAAPKFATTILGPAWTLSYEIWFYAIFAVLLFLPFEYALIGIGVWVYETLITSLLGQPWGFFNHPISIEFALGALVAIAFKKYASRLNLKALQAATAGFFVFLLLGVGFNWFSLIDDYVRILILGGFSALLLLTFILWDSTKPFKENILSKLGDASYPIYLVHTLIFINLRKLALHLPHELAILGLLLVVVTTGVLIHYLIEKPLLAQLKRFRLSFPALSRELP